jgi:N-acetylmuramoyl-L-alanine amidase
MKHFRAVSWNALRRLVRVAIVSLCAVTSAGAATVVIDAGHGGHDHGGLPGQKVKEKDVTLAVARKTASILREQGYRVVLTRSTDVFVGLRERCAIANAQHDAVFLSIHMNAAPRKTATGVETYYYSRRSARLAAALHAEVVKLMGTENRGIRQRGFFVIRRTNIPSVLVEPGFLSNAGEASRLNSSAFQSRLANALARGVMKGR